MTDSFCTAFEFDAPRLQEQGALAVVTGPVANVIDRSRQGRSSFEVNGVAFVLTTRGRVALGDMTLLAPGIVVRVHYTEHAGENLISNLEVERGQASCAGGLER